MPKPLFLLGVTPRSGTNFLRNIILTHPECEQASVVGEDFLIKNINYIDDYIKETFNEWSDVWDWSGESKESQKERLNRQIGNSLRAYLLPPMNKRYFLTTTPYTNNINRIKDYFPDAKIIVLIRNGKDTIESGVIGGFWNYERGFSLWGKSATRILSHVAKGDLLLVKYEDLLEKDTSVLKIFDFLNLSHDMIKFDEIRAWPVFGSSLYMSKSQPWRVVEKKEDFEPTKRSSNWHLWRKYRFDWICGDVSARFGYSKREERTLLYFIYNYLMDLRIRIKRQLRFIGVVKRMYQVFNGE